MSYNICTFVPTQEMKRILLSMRTSSEKPIKVRRNLGNFKSAKTMAMILYRGYTSYSAQSRLAGGTSYGRAARGRCNPEPEERCTDFYCLVLQSRRRRRTNTRNSCNSCSTYRNFQHGDAVGTGLCGRAAMRTIIYRASQHSRQQRIRYGETAPVLTLGVCRDYCKNDPNCGTYSHRKDYFL